MSLLVRDGAFDVVIGAAPRVTAWPSVGVRALSQICTEMGLSVGLFGGASLHVQGVIPLKSTGGLMLAQDIQDRIHRIHARAVVRVSPLLALPDPFPGWRSPGLIPLATAQRLRSEKRFPWHPVTVVLGTGNPALRFASDLLENRNCEEVYCVESYGKWGNKNYAGWEVEKRRFELLGGRILHAQPVELKQKSALLWELKLKDKVGTQLLNVARVVTAGPFEEFPTVREYPPGSLLFELVSTSDYSKVENPEGWELEKWQGLLVGSRIVRALQTDLGAAKRNRLNRMFREARMALKHLRQHVDEPFSQNLNGKWLAEDDLQVLKSFSGVPQQSHTQALKASIECLENITCRICEEACPETAIQINRGQDKSFLIEDKCTACGVCLEACPSRVPVMIKEKNNYPHSTVVLPWKIKGMWKKGDLATLLNRAGKPLGSARISAIENREEMDLVSVDVPTHLIWQARGLRIKTDEVQDDAYLFALKQSENMKAETVEITLNGKRRLVREGIPVAVALLESGWSRPSDSLLCDDGSCKLCRISVDGSTKLACQTLIHAGMAIKMNIADRERAEQQDDLCPCKAISKERIVDEVNRAHLSSPESVLTHVAVGSGRCHGQLCMGAFRRLIQSQGVDVSEWIDWRFPWMDWSLTGGTSD